MNPNTLTIAVVDTGKLAIPNREERTFDASIGIEKRSEGGPPVLVGYAALFDSPSQDLGGFVEVIQRGAFSQAIVRDDVRALFNHDANLIIGRNKSGTLRMTEDSRGLRVEIDPPDTQWARDLLECMRRGDVDQMSFGFSVKQDEWEKRDGRTIRTLKEVSLYDVSCVTYPAYLDTSIAVRSLESWRNSIEKPQVAKYRADIARVDLKRRLKND